MYKFEGHDWTELAECWGITVEEKPIKINILDDDNDNENDNTDIEPPDIKVKEKIDVVKRINGMTITFTIDYEEEVLAEKIKQHIHSRMHNYEELADIAKDMRIFLTALYKESKKIDYNYPVYKGMLELENDYTLAKWVLNNLEDLWT